MAAGAEAPFTSDRCTVYMERDLGVLLAEGWSPEEVAAAVLHSVRDNYLAKVVSRSPLGAYVVFQGATARNPALVAAFEQQLGSAHSRVPVLPPDRRHRGGAPRHRVTRRAPTGRRRAGAGFHFPLGQRRRSSSGARPASCAPTAACSRWPALAATTRPGA